MKTNHLFFSKVFTIAVSISIVLLSASLLIFSISSVNAVKAENAVADEKAHKMPWDENLKGAVGLGIVNNTGYFVIWGSLNNMLYKVDLTKARNWYDD